MNQDFNPRLLFLQQILAVHEDTEGECFPQDMAFIYSDGVLFQVCFSACVLGFQETDAQGSSMGVEFNLV